MKKFITLSIIGLMCLTPIMAFASDSDYDYDGDEESPVIIDAEDFENDEDLLEEEIIDALETEDHIRVLNLDSFDKEYDTPNIGVAAVEPLSAAGTVQYQVRNVKAKSNTFGSDYLNVSGSPGVTIGLTNSKTKSYSMTISASFGCPANIILSASWSTTKSKTLTYSGTWKVPSKHNGKSVKRGYLHMRPEYKNKSFDVYSRTFGYTNWKKKGTSATKRAYAVNIYKTYVYK